jgi:hypothetical protein
MLVLRQPEYGLRPALAAILLFVGAKSVMHAHLFKASKARALPWTRWGRKPQTAFALRGFFLLLGEANKLQGFLASPFPQRIFIVGVWGLRPQRVQGRALAFFLSVRVGC